MPSVPHDALWDFVCEQHSRSHYAIHGPEHWRRVERNGLILADALPNVDRDVIRLFALFHDAKRLNDGHDPGHGLRGALFAESLLGQEFNGTTFELESTRFELLFAACQLHTDQTHHESETIGCCMDADRLDLPRVGITTDARFLNTDFAKRIANLGGMKAFLERQ